MKIKKRPQGLKYKNRKSELDVMLEVMEQIKTGKIKPLTSEQRDELEKKYEVGKYRKWVYSEKRMDKIMAEIKETDFRFQPREVVYRKPAEYTTSKKTEEEYKKQLEEFHG